VVEKTENDVLDILDQLDKSLWLLMATLPQTKPEVALHTWLVSQGLLGPLRQLELLKPLGFTDVTGST